MDGRCRFTQGRWDLSRRSSHVAQLFSLGIVHAMTHLALYFGGVFGVLFAVTLGLVLVARATKWKPKPIKPVWAVSLVIGAVSMAGILCSIAGHDIHILYWWLVGIPAAVVLIAVLGGAMNVLVGWLHRKR